MSTPRARGRRTPSRLLRSLVIAGSGLALVALGPAGAAFADPCPLTDPLCVVETVEDTVDTTVGTAKDHADETVETAQKTVKDLTDPAGDPGGGGGGGGGDTGGGGDQGGGGRGHGPGTPGDGNPGAGPIVSVPATAGGASVVTVTETGVLPVDHREEIVPIIARGIPATLRAVAVGLAVPLLILLGIVVGFTMVQNRLDRRDPKLALAPLAEDVLRFA